MLVILYTIGFLGFLYSLGHFVEHHAGTSVGTLVEEKLGGFPHLVFYAVVECVVIVLIYVDGFLSFVSNELSKVFEERIPCLLCKRIDHALVPKSSIFYYNESLCEDHKKTVSSLAYCNVHKKLSDIRSMCQACLLSFAAEKDCDSDRYKSIVGILHNDVGFFLEDDEVFRAKSFRKGEKEVVLDEKNQIKCSCCGEPLRRSSSKYRRSLSICTAPAPSPRGLSFSGKIEELGNASLPKVRCRVSGSGSELAVDEDATNANNRGGVEAKSVAEPLLSSFDDKNEDTSKTPSFTSRNRFFANLMSPRWASMCIRTPKAEKLDTVSESTDAAKADDDNLARLKRQVSLNRKSLISLYMELDEERNASAVAANNAMAMITRLQAEKAAVQMEALQYQRMREEQAEYDGEALQDIRDMLVKREEDLKAVEAELEMYRERYGQMKDVGSEICEVDVDDDYQDLKTQNMSMLSEKSDCGSTCGTDPYENANAAAKDEGGNLEQPSLDIEGEKSHLLSLLKDLKQTVNSTFDEDPVLSELVEVKPEHESKAAVEDQNRGILTRELSLIKERLRVIEADSGFIKHTAKTLQRDGDGVKLFTEIAEHIRELRQPGDLPSEIINA